MIYNDPPACLRILSPESSISFPDLPEELHSILSYSDISLINLSNETIPTLPPAFTGNGIVEEWCYYFESADLARQRGEWDTSAAFADQALAVGHPDSPAKHVTEYEVFVDGYAHAGRWDDAKELTLEAFKIDESIKPFLCETWNRVVAQTGDSSERSAAVEIIAETLSCHLN